MFSVFKYVQKHKSVTSGDVLDSAAPVSFFMLSYWQMILVYDKAGGIKLVCPSSLCSVT